MLLLRPFGGLCHAVSSLVLGAGLSLEKKPGFPRRDQSRDPVERRGTPRQVLGVEAMGARLLRILRTEPLGGHWPSLTVHITSPCLAPEDDWLARDG